MIQTCCCLRGARHVDCVEQWRQFAAFPTATSPPAKRQAAFGRHKSKQEQTHRTNKAQATTNPPQKQHNSTATRCHRCLIIFREEKKSKQKANSTTMNSIAYQMRRMSIESSALPPASLSASMVSAADSQDFELDFDCSGFDAMSPAPSYGSFSSQSSAGWGNGGLSRSRCVNNLSSLGSASSADVGVGSARQMHAPGPNAGWGYFVDTPAR